MNRADPAYFRRPTFVHPFCGSLAPSRDSLPGAISHAHGPIGRIGDVFRLPERAVYRSAPSFRSLVRTTDYRYLRLSVQNFGLN